MKIPGDQKFLRYSNCLAPKIIPRSNFFPILTFGLNNLSTTSACFYAFICCHICWFALTSLCTGLPNKLCTECTLISCIHHVISGPTEYGYRCIMECDMKTSLHSTMYHSVLWKMNAQEHDIRMSAQWHFHTLHIHVNESSASHCSHTSAMVNVDVERRSKCVGHPIWNTCSVNASVHECKKWKLTFECSNNL